MEPVVEVTGGKIQGRTTAGVSAFLGVPYAAPPIGAARFQAPRPVREWDGVREATELGATCVQSDYPAEIAAILGKCRVPGPEYLNVNVWTPDPGGSGLPVMVWIHGGAFTRGSNAIPAYDGAAFARDGVVLVSVNYRLGASGFAILDGAVPNRGLRDQLYALAWVQENIRAFGGDPDNVTIFGESAGAMSVASLLGSPAAYGLFGKAIMQSGNGGAACTLDDARLLGKELAVALGIPATAEAFAAVEPGVLLAAQDAVYTALTKNPDPARWGASVLSGGIAVMTFLPVVDGEILTGLPIDAIAAGSARDIAVLAGTNTEEFRLFTVPTGLGAAVTAEMLPYAIARFGIDPAVIDVYAEHRPDAAPGDLFAAIITDAAFRGPTRQLVQAQQALNPSAYLYEFAWRRTDDDLGAMHGLEIPFVFDTLAAAPSLSGPNPPQRIADEMHSAWVEFAKSGDPGWPPYGDSRVVMTFDEPYSALVRDPRADENAGLPSPVTS
ncbi:carboxylesterase family protein [Nocardia sp. SYP-A9097]|uniref:carboxylesterase/lipase family protein n=1 Tax=Nocardia sp. SYP-A9097 TaxID=2663237 RepID=UPI001320C83A|nr:carboxylesterase family protein [Nocardia sp. SYP-A9097]MRH89619.1 carboxylesterase family protein [Nocardia sp. SYP-A9097]